MVAFLLAGTERCGHDLCPGSVGFPAAPALPEGQSDLPLRLWQRLTSRIRTIGLAQWADVILSTILEWLQLIGVRIEPLFVLWVAAMMAEIDPALAPATSAILVQDACDLVDADHVCLGIGVRAARCPSGLHQIPLAPWTQTSQDVASLPRRGCMVQTLWGRIPGDASAIFKDTIVGALLTSSLALQRGAQATSVQYQPLCFFPGHRHLIVADIGAPTCDREPVIGRAVRPSRILLSLRAHESAIF
mmetsp:Transcript_6155/g.17005  ORF Transcript_6155/g.17005 Transcript_6155/m.17005 type:complete len:246 (-) Transcript_6155:448-1185(-)